MYSMSVTSYYSIPAPVNKWASSKIAPILFTLETVQ
jgi:hypothetical protein